MVWIPAQCGEGQRTYKENVYMEETDERKTNMLGKAKYGAVKETVSKDFFMIRLF